MVKSGAAGTAEAEANGAQSADLRRVEQCEDLSCFEYTHMGICLRRYFMTLVQIYRCLCDMTRLRILHLLKQGPLCVCHFQDILQLPQVAVSKHLAYLRRTSMVEASRHEQWMIYSLPSCPGRELDLQLRCLQDCVQTEPVFRADLSRLKALEPECVWIPKALNARSSSKKPARTGCRPVRCDG